MNLDPILAIFGPLSVTSAVLVVTRRNPVYSAVWLLICFLSFAVVFLQLSAAFLAAIHVLVYTGAILVLFLFVIMLLNFRDDELGDEYPLQIKLACALLSFALFGLIAVPVWMDPGLRADPGPAAADFGSVQGVAEQLFKTYALPFELVSLLIVVAMFGAMVLAKKRVWT